MFDARDDLAHETRALLDAVVQTIRRYVVLTTHQVAAIALWVVMTWAVGAFDVAAYIHIKSPTKRTGKSRLLEVLSLMVARAWLTGRVTAAVLVRKLAAQSPTLLLDETDAALKSGDEYAEALRGVLDSGYRQGGQVSLCVGQGAAMTFKDFDVFGPKAFAGIEGANSRMPETVRDRAIQISIHRRRADEPVARFRWRDAKAETAALRDRLAVWGTQATALLQDARPEIPDTLNDRASEIWEGLLAIADLAGVEWPARARQAALQLSGGNDEAEDSAAIQLLADVRAVFFNGQDRLPTKAVLEALHALDESPWAEWARGRPLSARQLARMLRPFGVSPTVIRVGEMTSRGYRREDLQDAFARYLPPENVTSVTEQAGRGDSQFFEAKQMGLVTDAKNGETPRLERVVTHVTDTKPDMGSFPGDDGRRAALVQMGAVLGWPGVDKDGIRIPAGRTGWLDFARDSDDATIARALEVIQ